MFVSFVLPPISLSVVLSVAAVFVYCLVSFFVDWYLAIITPLGVAGAGPAGGNPTMNTRRLPSGARIIHFTAHSRSIEFVCLFFTLFSVRFPSFSDGVLSCSVLLCLCVINPGPFFVTIFHGQNYVVGL